MNRSGGGGGMIFPSMRPGAAEVGGVPQRQQPRQQQRSSSTTTKVSSRSVVGWSSYFDYRRAKDTTVATTTMNTMIRPPAADSGDVEDDNPSPPLELLGEATMRRPRRGPPPARRPSEEVEAATAEQGDDEEEGGLLFVSSAGDTAVTGTKKATTTTTTTTEVDNNPPLASAAVSNLQRRQRRSSRCRRREEEEEEDVRTNNNKNDVWTRKRLRRLDMLQQRFRKSVQRDQDWETACVLGHHYLRTWMRFRHRQPRTTPVHRDGNGHGHGPEDVNKVLQALGEAIVRVYHHHPRCPIKRLHPKQPPSGPPWKADGQQPLEEEEEEVPLPAPPGHFRFLSSGSEEVPIEDCYRNLDVLYQLYLDAIEAKQWRDAYLHGTTYWTLVVWFAPQHLDYHKPKYVIHEQRHHERARGILLMLESVAKRCDDDHSDDRGDCGSGGGEDDDDDVTEADVVAVATTASTSCANAAPHRECDGADASSNPNAEARPTDATHAGVGVRVHVDDEYVQQRAPRSAAPESETLPTRTAVDVGPPDEPNDTVVVTNGPRHHHDAVEREPEPTERAAVPGSETVLTRTGADPTTDGRNDDSDAEFPSRHRNDDDAELDLGRTNRARVFQDVRHDHMNAPMGIDEGSLAKEKSKGAVCQSSDRPASGSGIIAADPTTAARGRRSTNKRVSPSSTVERQGRETRARRSSRHSSWALDVQRRASTRDDDAAPTLERLSAPAARDGVGAELSVDGRHDSDVDTSDFTRPTHRCLKLMREIDAAIASGVCRSEALGILEAAATHFGMLAKGSKGRTVVLCQWCAECRSDPRRAFVTSYQDPAMRSPGSTTTTVFFDDFDNATEIPKNARGELRRHVKHQQFRGVAVRCPPYLEDP